MPRLSDTDAGNVRSRKRGRAPSAAHVVLVTVVICLAAGLVVGVLWWLFAPQFSVQMVGGQLQPLEPVGESRFGADAWFSIISGAAGVLIALVVFTRYRQHPVTTVGAVAAGGLLGSVVAWRLGVLLGPDPIEGALEDIADGTRLGFPLDLGATGALFAWPVAALVTVVLICLLGNDEGRWRPGSEEPNLSRADRSVPWSLP